MIQTKQKEKNTMREKEMKECVCAEPCEGMLEDMPVTYFPTSKKQRLPSRSSDSHPGAATPIQEQRLPSRSSDSHPGAATPIQEQQPERKRETNERRKREINGRRKREINGRRKREINGRRKRRWNNAVRDNKKTRSINCSRQDDAEYENDHM